MGTPTNERKGQRILLTAANGGDPNYLEPCYFDKLIELQRNFQCKKKRNFTIALTWEAKAVVLTTDNSENNPEI